MAGAVCEDLRFVGGGDGRTFYFDDGGKDQGLCLVTDPNIMGRRNPNMKRDFTTSIATLFGDHRLKRRRRQQRDHLRRWAVHDRGEERAARMGNLRLRSW